MIPRIERQVLPFALLALVAGSIALMRGANWPRGRQFWTSVWIGLGLFAAPTALAYVSGGWVSGPARTALFTLTPVFAVAFDPYLGGGPGPQIRGSLLAVLVAVAGAFLVFPVVLPASIEAGLCFCAMMLAAACVAAANCVAVRAVTGLNGESIAPMASIAGAIAAASLASASALLEPVIWKWTTLAPELLWSAAIEAPGLFLLFWLMRRMSAPRMATRYVFAPLLAILIGVSLLRSGSEVRLQTWLGLISMAVGAGWLLFAPCSSDEASSTNLPLNLTRNR